MEEGFEPLKIMQIPFVDLKLQYKNLKPEIDQAIGPVLENAQYILGPAVESFEKNFADFLGVGHVIGVSSGTDALYLVLRALDIGEGDEVIIPPNTFIATAEAISMAGAAPVFVDVEEKAFNIDIDKIEEKITSRTKAIMPVHLTGQAVDMDKIMEMAKKCKLFVIEDACQAHGSEYRGKKLGTIGEAGCFSFYPGKNLGAFGEAGAVAANNGELAEKLRILRDHGQSKKYYHNLISGNFRMAGIQGAVLDVKLKHLDEWNELRRSHAEMYKNLLGNAPEIILPQEPSYSKGNYHLFIIRAQKRDELQKFLAENGIVTGIHYPVPIHLQKAYGYLGLAEGSFPVSEKLAKEILSLPMYPELITGQIEYVCEKVKRFYQK
jgi:dTDP-4-amino-4,6-dideoxygalactose transaminase